MVRVGMDKLILLLALTGYSRAWLFGGPKPDWDGLAVTWGVNPFNSNYFDQLPRTEAAAKRSGWTKVSGCPEQEELEESSGEEEKPVSLGNRYMLKNDPAVMLLYGSNGYIAGIQQGIKKDNFPTRHMKYAKTFSEDTETGFMVQTAYFIPPKRICAKGQGRTKKEFDSDGTGTDLYLQNGPDPIADSIKIPKQEKDIGKTKWTKGRCFWTMGQHYWYDISADMSCDDFYPAFLLYNKGKLNGFGWAMTADYTSPRYEHPPKRALSKFFHTPPQCLYKEKYLSTMHIYMDDNPRSNFC